MKKVLTIILDGFGMREDMYGNAVKMAGMNNFINIWNNYPHCLLKASGKTINLPDKQCSNSELGHEIIGSGRLIDNDLSMLNNVFKRENLKYNQKYNNLVDDLNNSEKRLHIITLLSDGGVSSHINHLKCFLNELSRSKVKNNIYIHAISDGIDTNKRSIKKYLRSITGYIGGNIKLASLCGRYYALDNTRDYKRIKVYYDMLYNGKGINAENNLSRVIDKCYERKLTDEYLPPIKTNDYSGIENKDLIMILNFSKENQFELLSSMEDDSFLEFEKKQVRPKIFSFFEIEKTLNKNYFYERTKEKNTLCEYISTLGLTIAKIYEQCRHKNMTYYLEGKRNIELNNCDLFMVDTPQVSSYDKKPEMNALSVAKKIIKCMENDYDFIIANFANPDEVGHTGNYQATINGLQAIDVCLGKILEVAENNFYKIIILGDHAKADTIIDRENNIVTKNTLSPVPFIIMDKKIKLKNGDLTQVAPTILKYLDISSPKEMKNTETLF